MPQRPGVWTAKSALVLRSGKLPSLADGFVPLEASLYDLDLWTLADLQWIAKGMPIFLFNCKLLLRLL